MTTASHTNGRSQHTGPLNTAGYQRPRARGNYLTGDRGRFQRHRHVEWMLEDPMIQYVLSLLMGPVFSARVEVISPDQRVKAWAAKQFRTLWDTALPRLLLDLLAWGSCGGETTLKEEDGLLSIGEVADIHFYDRKPWLAGGQVVGVNVYGVPGRGAPVRLRKAGHNTEPGDIVAPWFWLTNGGSHGDPWGWPRIAGCFAPWWERHAPKGLKDNLRLYGFRHAFGGDTLYYPVGQQNVGGTMVSNADFSDSILAARENGASLSIPGDTNEAGKRLWELVPGEPGARPEFLTDRDEKLDKLYYLGAGIPPEVGEAAEVGGGWSSRAHPFLSFLKLMDQLVGTVVRGLDACTVRPAAELNFGPGVRYEPVPVSLVPLPKEEGKDEPPGEPPGAGAFQPPGQRQTPPPAQLAADAPADDRGLADLWAEILSGITTQGEEPDEELLDLATAHLEGGQWVIVQEDDGTWEVRHASEVDEEPVQLAAEKAPKGGITLTNKKGESKFYAGGRYIPAQAVKELPPAEKGKLDAAQAAAAAGKAGRVEGRQARGSVDVAALKAKLAPHAQELDRKKLGNAKRAWAALRSHHGELALHRVEELHDALAKQLERYAGNELMQEHLRGQMAKLNAVAGMAEQAGVTGKVEMPVREPSEAERRLGHLMPSEITKAAEDYGVVARGYEASRALRKANPGMGLDAADRAGMLQAIQGRMDEEAELKKKGEARAGARTKAQQEYADDLKKYTPKDLADDYKEQKLKRREFQLGAIRDEVKARLAAGKPVPPEVLKDYPDLAPPPPARPAATAPTATPTPAPAAKSGLAESAPMPEGNRRELAAAGSTSERIKAASSADVHTLDPLYGTPDWEVMGLGNNEALRTLDTRYHSLKRTRDSGGLDPKRYREDAARINGSMDDTAAVVRQAAAGLRKVGKVAAADWYERHGLALVEEARKDLFSGQKGA